VSFNSSNPRSECVATAGQTVFSFLFKIYATTDIKVYITAVGESTPVLQTETTDYTVVIDGDAGGTVTLVSGAAEDETITLIRRLPVTRSVEYQTSGDLLAATLNGDQEYQTYLIADGMDALGALETGDFSPSSFVLIAGGTMTGHLGVPSGATGAQVPQAQKVVHKANSESITGTKTFTVSPIVPTATAATHVVNKTQMEDYADSASAAVVVDTLIVNDTKTSGTDGGTFTLGDWRTRDLNTVQNNDISGASLASNQITLPAGTYLVIARAPAHEVTSHVSRLYDTTGAAELVLGSIGFSQASTSDSDTDSSIYGVFTIGVESVIEVQHQSSATQATDGFGSAGSMTSNIYTQIELRKTA